MQAKKLYSFLLPFLAFAIMFSCAAPAHAQSLYNVLTQADLSSPCNPQLGADATNTYGCCGSPGLRECGADLHYTKWLSTGCTDPDSNVYHADTQDCNLGSPSVIVSPISPNYPARGGRDFTFYVTSDSHPWRDTFNVAGQLNQVTAINGFPGQQVPWSQADRLGPYNGLCVKPCTGLPNTPISAPMAIWFAGDMTTNGAPNALGAFRLLWEQGLIAGGINYPVFVGLGNHDLYTDVTSQSSALEMWNYIRDRMGATNMDLSSNGALGIDDGNGSHDYSRDWQGVHIVQLNTAPGDPSATQYTNRTQNSQAWLNNDLLNATANDPYKPIIIIQHYPNKNESGDQAEFDALKRYNVIGMFVGHNHVVSTTRVSDFSGASAVTFDEFNDGAGGYCKDAVSDCPESGSVGEFIPVRVTDNYMDVAIAEWSWNAQAGAPGAPGLLTADTSGNLMMAGGYGGCRKRINTFYNNISYAFSGLPSSASNYSSIQVKSPNYLIHGPVAARLEFPSGNQSAGAARHDFVDACTFGADGNAGNEFIILNNGQDIPANTMLTIAPYGATYPSPNWNAEIFRMVPLQSAATPSLVTYTTQNGQVYASQPPVLNQEIGTQNVVLNGPHSDVLTFSISYLKSDDGTTPVGWLGLQQPSGCHTLLTTTLDATGYASIPLCFIMSPSLFNMTAGVANAYISVHGTSGQVYSFSASLTLRASISVSLSAIAGSNPPQFKASMTYLPLDPTSPDGAKIPLGQIQLQQVTLGLAGAQQGAATVLSTQSVNDPSADCPDLVKDQAIFGAQGDGTEQHCGASSQGASPSGPAFTFPTAKGLYYLQASYVGEGASPSPGPWFFPDLSPPLAFVIGSKTIAVIARGNNQSTPVGQTFAAMDVSIASAQGDWLPQDLLVTITLPPTGPSGMFADGTKQIIIPTFGDAKIPVITANSIPGKWTMKVNADGGAAPLFFELTNLPAGEFPVMSASRSSTQGTLTQRIWNFDVASAGPASVATPQIDSVVIAPIMPKTASTGIFCNAPTLLTRLPLKLPGPFSASGGSQIAPIAMSFGQCDPKALYNVTITLSDGAGHTSGSYLKAVTP